MRDCMLEESVVCTALDQLESVLKQYREATRQAAKRVV